MDTLPNINKDMINLILDSPFNYSGDKYSLLDL